MTRTVVHLVRHGEVHNTDGLLYGRLPGFHLSDVGRKQAKIVAQDLAGRDVTYVVSSPLERAQETAAPIAAAHRLDVATDERLIEASNKFEGMQVAIGDGALLRPQHWPKLYNPFRPSWGEPYLQVAQRMLAALQAARAQAAGHEAVCVSHQLPIWTLRRYLQGLRLWHDPRNRECSLGSITSVTFDGERLAEIVYSEPAGATDPGNTGA